MPPEARMDALVGTVLEGAYRITRLIGEGGMGAVYEAMQLRLNKRVAIKLMARDLASNREALARFHREAEITSHLGHPHLVNVVDFGQAESGEPYLVMEYLEGEDLDHRLRRVGRMSIEAVVHVVRQVASALNAAHDQGVVHRDLKPGNVFLVQIPGEPDFVKILDFGISKMKAARTQLTSASAVMGTPNYMAPEQATGMLEEIDHRTDQWALACIAWEMLLGHGPFVADETAALLYQIINLDPHPLAPRVPGLPPAVETALRRALRKKPAERFSSMREFSRELESAAFGRPADVTPAPVLVSSIAPPTTPTIGYSATQTPLTPVRQPAALVPRDARKPDAGVAQPAVGWARRLLRSWTKSIHEMVARANELARSATGQLSRIKPIYPVVAGAGVLLLLGAFLLLRSSPTPKTAVTSPAPPVVTPLPQPPEPPVVTAEPTEAKPAQATPTSARPKRQKWVDPFTSGDFDKPAKTTTPAPPRHKAKRKMFQEL
ncbi:MAG: serine/threonine-protein kinase [Polyangia bacterium]